MASIRTRPNGTFSVLWRDPKTRKSPSMGFHIESEAVHLKELLNANGQSLELASEVQRQFKSTAPNVERVIEEHIKTVTGVTERTMADYRAMARTHISPYLGHIPMTT